jgi:hypothetical protein
MKTIGSLLRRLPKPESKARNELDAVGDEIGKYFGSNLHWTVRKYGKQWAYEAYRECMERGKCSRPYYLAILKNRLAKAPLSVDPVSVSK